MPITDCCAVVGVWPRSPADLSVGALTAAMQARGVARAIAAHTAAIFYDASAGNRAMEAAARETPGLLPAAVINPARFPACVTEAQRARAAGVVCFRFYPGLHGYPLARCEGPEAGEERGGHSDGTLAQRKKGQKGRRPE